MSFKEPKLPKMSNLQLQNVLVRLRKEMINRQDEYEKNLSPENAIKHAFNEGSVYMIDKVLEMLSKDGAY